MKKLFIASVAFLLTLGMSAQKKGDSAQGYKFTVVKENPITSIKNQGSSGTCWSFSGVGFLESELLRMGKGEHDLSEMYIVRRNYEDKAQKYVRVDGNLNFAQGGSFADVMETLDEYGVVPNEVMNGLNYGETGHKHGELEAGLSGYLKGIAKNPNKKISTAWIKGFDGILDAYLGEKPENFTYQGQNYTPQGLANELDLKSDNYISFTSFTHHPFFKAFALELPDNWRWFSSYNVPMNDIVEIIDNAIETGYTVAWATDVSELGFTRNGIGLVPDLSSSENIGSDQARWLGLSVTEKNAEVKKKVDEGPLKELEITQEMRQIAFDNQETTDDHGMQIYGIAKDQNGNKYYMVKNSWGLTGAYKGIWYVSETFVKYKTTNITVNKESVPSSILAKLK